MRPGKNLWLVSLLAILVAVGLVAAVLLIQQTQPAVPTSGTLNANCTTTSATPTNVTLGGNGQITFSCNSQTPTTSPAFTASGAVLATPTVTNFLAPYNSTGLFIYVANGAVNTGACSSRTGAIRVTDGSSTLLPVGAYNYCAKYEAVGPTGLPQFTVAWNL
ncbi:MAG: hypothetical protein E6J93_08795 [Methanobacteriota archaeon]|nr:MAG: hypothetical protein E6J93_08795 [Euryarchaeota archaeon]